MAVKSRALRSRRIQDIRNLFAGHMRMVSYVVTMLLALLATYVLLGRIVTWCQVTLDDMRYGRPRTFYVDAFVGHGEEAGLPTSLMAMNLNRQVVVIEVPGGDTQRVRAFTGPYLFGQNEDLTPVTMRLDDINRDEQRDLIILVKNEEVVYLNRDGTFVLMTPTERQQLLRQPSTP